MLCAAHRLRRGSRPGNDANSVSTVRLGDLRSTSVEDVALLRPGS